MSSEVDKLQIAIPIFDGLAALDAIGPFESLQHLPNVDVVFVGYERREYNTCLGKVCLTATATFDEVPNPDIIIIPGGFDDRLLAEDQPIIAWIRKVHLKTKLTTAVCQGSVLLGATGLLKGVHANTHWAVVDQLESYGAILTNKRVVRDGKFFTTAGVSSGIDLGLRLVQVIIDELTAHAPEGPEGPKEPDGDTIGEASQVFIQYDPEPPFNGNPEKASAEVKKIALGWAATGRKYVIDHFPPPP